MRIKQIHASPKEIQRLQEVVQSVTGVPVEEMMSRCRKIKHVISRQLVIYYARKVYNCTFYECADIFNLNHATCINGVNRITKDRLYSASISPIIQSVDDILLRGVPESNLECIYKGIRVERIGTIALTIKPRTINPAHSG